MCYLRYIKRFCDGDKNVDSAMLLYIVKKFFSKFPALYTDFTKMHMHCSLEDWQVVADRVKTLTEISGTSWSQGSHPKPRSENGAVVLNRFIFFPLTTLT
jgi:hypothetical protein